MKIEITISSFRHMIELRANVTDHETQSHGEFIFEKPTEESNYKMNVKTLYRVTFSNFDLNASEIISNEKEIIKKMISELNKYLKMELPAER